MNELEWNGEFHYAPLRKAIAFLLEREEWRGKYYRYSDLVDALNILCDYSESNDNMKKVDVAMIAEAFNLKNACAGRDKLAFPSTILTGQDNGGDTSRRRSGGRTSSRPNNPEGGNEYTFHLYRRKLGNNSEKREYKVGCTRSGDEEPKDIEGREGGWSPHKFLKIYSDIQRQMLSTKIQNAAAINKYRQDRDDLRRGIVGLVKFSEDTFGDDNKLALPLTLKCFSMFGDGMIDKQGDNWHNFGALDEENTESAHARMNSVSSLFGACRGTKKKQLTINKLLLSCNQILTEGIAEIKEGTKSKRKSADGNSQRQPRRSATDDSHEEEEDEYVQAGQLRDYEIEMNENEMLRVPSDFEHEDRELAAALKRMETLIHVCPKCSIRLVGNDALRIHMKESHNKKLQAEHDAIDGAIT